MRTLIVGVSGALSAENAQEMKDAICARVVGIDDALIIGNCSAILLVDSEDCPEKSIDHLTQEIAKGKISINKARALQGLPSLPSEVGE